jgi:hypothetical protein
MHERKAQSDAEWNAWLSAGIEAALSTEGHVLRDTLVGLIVELRREWRDEIQTAVGELRAELLAVQRSAERGKILDLPALPLRRRSDAA